MRNPSMNLCRVEGSLRTAGICALFLYNPESGGACGMQDARVSASLWEPSAGQKGDPSGVSEDRMWGMCGCGPVTRWHCTAADISSDGI